MNKQLLALGLAALFAGTVQAATMPEKEVGLLLGGSWLSDNATGSDDQLNPTFGLRYGQRLGTSTNFFSDLTYTPYSWQFGKGSSASSGDGDLYTLRGGMEWLFSQQPKYNWFLSGGLGVMYANMDNGGDSFTRPLLSVGVGQAWEVGANDAIRWEIRTDQSFGNGDLPGSSLTNVQALVGYSWGLGKPLDSDGDGVIDRRDQCPNTPAGAKVDSKGCPLDSDGDGVFDGIDQCPDTPKGAKVNSKGCPLDSDGDGVYDGIDQCPDTPKDVKVDAQGCPIVVVEEVVVVETLVLQGIHFADDSAVIMGEFDPVLDQAAAALNSKAWQGVKVEVAGYCDIRGTEEYNLKLSERRANTVRDYLIKKGVAADRLTAKGYGKTNFIADNDTEEGRYKNRRVELVPQR